MSLRTLLYGSPVLCDVVAWLVLVTVTILVRRKLLVVQAYNNKRFHICHQCEHDRPYVVKEQTWCLRCLAVPMTCQVCNSHVLSVSGIGSCIICMSQFFPTDTCSTSSISYSGPGGSYIRLLDDHIDLLLVSNFPGRRSQLDWPSLGFLSL